MSLRMNFVLESLAMSHFIVQSDQEQRFRGMSTLETSPWVDDCLWRGVIIMVIEVTCVNHGEKCIVVGRDAR
jgi:hypothetical protein